MSGLYVYGSDQAALSKLLTVMGTTCTTSTPKKFVARQVYGPNTSCLQLTATKCSVHRLHRLLNLQFDIVGQPIKQVKQPPSDRYQASVA